MFELNASYSFINASCVTDLGLEVEAFIESMCGCSYLGCRVRVDMIGKDCELEISVILLMVDLLGGSHRVRCGCTVTPRRVGCGCMVWSFTTLRECGLSLSLGLRPIKTHGSNQKMKSNQGVLGKARRGPLIPPGEKAWSYGEGDPR